MKKKCSETIRNAQVGLDPSLFQKNALSSLHVTDFDVESFIDFLKSNLVTEELRSLYCKLGNELDERTSSISEMIPDDVWMSVFQYLPRNKDISYYLPLKNVCKRWRNMYSNTTAIVAAPIISPPSHFLQVSSFGAIRKLEIDSPFCVSLELFQTVFPPLETLILSSPDVTCSPEVTFDLWRQLTNLKHLEICDFPESPNCNYCDFGRRRGYNYSDFIIDSDALFELTSLETLVLGNEIDSGETTSLRLSSTDLSLFTNLSKLRIIYDCDSGKREEILERDMSDKLNGRGKLSWPNGFRDNEDDYEKLLDRDRYEGDIDYIQGEYAEFNFIMHGEGVLYYKEGNEYDALRFEGVFENNKEKEGVIYFLHGDKYEGKFPKITHSPDPFVCWYEGVGKIVYQNGDVYTGETKDFKMIPEKGILIRYHS